MDSWQDLGVFIVMLVLAPLFAVVFLLACVVVLPVLALGRAIRWLRGR